jgi:hypothetical protein
MAYKPKEGQDIFDVCLQFYGNIEAGLFELVKANNLTIDSTNLQNRELTLNNNGNGDKKVISFFSNNNFTPTNVSFDSVIGDFNSDFNNDFY